MSTANSAVKLSMTQRFGRRCAQIVQSPSDFAVVALLVFGAVLRAWHWLRTPAVWHDEAALVLNVLQKNFVELWGPLRFSEAAPPLFLWLEKFVSQIAGDGILALRAPAAMGGALALLFTWLVARRWLTATGIVVSLLLIACCDRLLWHGCEAKQYAIEAGVTAGLLWIYAATHEWASLRRTLLFAAIAPIVIGLSYPGCFLLGAYLLAELPSVWRSGRSSSWIGYGAATVLTLGSFAILCFGPIAAQHDATITACWEGMNKFPSYDRPWSMPLWVVDALASACDYCFRPIGLLLLPLVVVGTRQVSRTQGYAVAMLLIGPFLLALAAAMLHAYPFGGSRVAIFAAPALAILIGAGVERLLAICSPQRSLLAAALTAVLLLLPITAAYRVVSPWNRAACDRAAAFVQRHRLPGDRVASNHWEYEYYFRSDADKLLAWPAASVQPSRVWVVVSGAQTADRQQLVAHPPTPQHRKLVQQEFERTTVVLFARSDQPSRR